MSAFNQPTTAAPIQSAFANNQFVANPLGSAPIPNPFGKPLSAANSASSNTSQKPVMMQQSQNPPAKMQSGIESSFNSVPKSFVPRNSSPLASAPISVNNSSQVPTGPKASRPHVPLEYAQNSRRNVQVRRPVVPPQPAMSAEVESPLGIRIAQLLQSKRIFAPALPKDSNGSIQTNLLEKHWHSYKDYRKKVRDLLIHEGLLDDPDKPKKLSEAIDFKGICEDMCPEFEKITRIMESNVYDLEKEKGQPSLHKMVKALARSSAGQDAPLPMDVRSPGALRRTVDYLLNTVLGEEEGRLPAVHGFLWDRTRAIRRDFVFQSSMNSKELLDQVYCLEKITRFHVIALHIMSDPGLAAQAEGFSEQQELEQLGKSILSLIHAYEDCQSQNITCENEEEFRAYYVLFNSSDPGILETVQDWGWKFWGQSEEIQLAVSLVETLQNTWDMHGPLKPLSCTDISQNAYSRFFSIIEDPTVSYTMACFAEIHFNRVRKAAMKTIANAYRRPRDQTKDWTLPKLNQYLRFDEEEEIIEFCEAYGLNFEEHDQQTYLSFEINPDIVDPFPPLKQQHSRNIVERKRGNHTLPEVMNTTIFETRLDDMPEKTSFKGSRSIPFDKTDMVPVGNMSHTQPVVANDTTFGSNWKTSQAPSFEQSSTSSLVQSINLPHPKEKLAETEITTTKSLFSNPTGSKPLFPANDNVSQSTTPFFPTPSLQSPLNVETTQPAAVLPNFIPTVSSSANSFAPAPLVKNAIAGARFPPDTFASTPSAEPNASFVKPPIPNFVQPASTSQLSFAPIASDSASNSSAFASASSSAPSSLFTSKPVASPTISESDTAQNNTYSLNASKAEQVIPEPQTPHRHPFEPAQTVLQHQLSSPKEHAKIEPASRISSTSASPAQVQLAPNTQQVAPVTETSQENRKARLDGINEWVVNGVDGLIDMITLTWTEQLVVNACKIFIEEEKERVAREKDERDRQEAYDYRHNFLAVKYYRKWHTLARNMAMRRRGRQARKAREDFAREIKAKKATQAADLVDDFKASTKATRVTPKKSRRPSLESLLDATGVLDGVHDSDSQLRHITHEAEDNHLGLKRRRSDRVSQTPTNHSSIANSHKRGKSENSSRRKLLSNSSYTSSPLKSLQLSSSASFDPYRSSRSGVQTDYFRLKARGVPVMSEDHRRALARESAREKHDLDDRDSDTGSTYGSPKSIPFVSPSAQDIQVLKSRAKALVEKGIVGEKKRKSLDPEDEELFARAKRVRDQMDTDSAWYRAELKRMSTPRSFS